MQTEPVNKVLPFRLREPMPTRWQCPCGSTLFTLWDDGRVYCGHCYGHHYRIQFVVDEHAEPPPPA